MNKISKSHPSWVCGLKHRKIRPAMKSQGVTPFVGVWIETHTNSMIHRIWKSHPSWVCGLKLIRLMIFCHNSYVTPFVGVWIETR